MHVLALGLLVISPCVYDPFCIVWLLSIHFDFMLDNNELECANVSEGRKHVDSVADIDRE